MSTLKTLGWLAAVVAVAVGVCWMIGIRLENYDECIRHGFSKQYCLWASGR